MQIKQLALCAVNLRAAHENYSTENIEPTFTQLATSYSVAVDDAAGYLRNISSLRTESFIYKSQTRDHWRPDFPYVCRYEKTRIKEQTGHGAVKEIERQR